MIHEKIPNVTFKKRKKIDKGKGKAFFAFISILKEGYLKKYLWTAIFLSIIWLIVAICITMSASFVIVGLIVIFLGYELSRYVTFKLILLPFGIPLQGNTLSLMKKLTANSNMLLEDREFFQMWFKDNIKKKPQLKKYNLMINHKNSELFAIILFLAKLQKIIDKQNNLIQ